MTLPYSLEHNGSVCTVAGVQGVEAIVFPPLRSIQSKAVDKADQGEYSHTVYSNGHNRYIPSILLILINKFIELLAWSGCGTSSFDVAIICSLYPRLP